jgi:hypothetical protein
MTSPLMSLIKYKFAHISFLNLFMKSLDLSIDTYRRYVHKGNFKIISLLS